MRVVGSARPSACSVPITLTIGSPSSLIFADSFCSPLDFKLAPKNALSQEVQQSCNPELALLAELACSEFCVFCSLQELDVRT